MSRSAMFFCNLFKLPPANFFLGNGGILYPNSSSITTAQIGLLNEELKDATFRIDGSNNVSFALDTPAYTVSFCNSSTITYIIDLDGWFTFQGGINFMKGVTNCKYIYLPNIRPQGSIRDFASSCNALLHINLEGFNIIKGNNLLYNAINLKKAYFPDAHTIEYIGTTVSGGLKNCTNLERLYLGNVTTLDTNTQLSIINNNSTVGAFYGLNTNCKVYYNSVFGVGDQRAWNKMYFNTYLAVGDIFTINGLTYEAVDSGAVEGQFNIGGKSVSQQKQELNQRINADTRTGTWSKVRSTMYNDFTLMLDDVGASGNTVAITYSGLANVTYYNSTFVGGDNDIGSWLQGMRDIIGVNPSNFIEVNLISVNAPTSLSYSNLTATTVDLDFIAPTPNANGTDAFEVWVSDVTIYRKLFEYDEISLSGDTLDLTEVKNDIGSLSGVKIKIRTIDGHMNFSDFSNEIILP